nr:hypothetical protein [Clostridia bacterium]
MFKLKKLTSLALLAAMLMTAASCASDTADNTAETTTSAETTVAETTTEPPEYIAPEGVDYNGETFTICSNSWDVGVWVFGGYCESFAKEENGDPINDALYQRNRKVEEELNIKIDLYPIRKQSSTTEITTAILSGDDMFKVASPNGSSLPTLLNSAGMLTDLNKLETFDYTASWWDQRSVEEFNLYDTQYAVTGDFNLFNKGAVITNFFSQKLVSDLKLDDPYKLVDDGKWTLDKMFEFCSAAARDVNGDGQMIAEDDCFGLMGEGSTTMQFVRGTGQRLSERTADGDIKIVFNSEKTVSVVEKFIPFFRNKEINLYSGDHSKNYSNVFLELFAARFIEDSAMFYSNQLLVALNLRNMEADFGILPLPKLDESQDKYYGSTNNSWCTFVVVPVTNGKLEMTGNVLNSLGYHSQQIVTPAFIDQTVMDKALRDENSARMVELIFDTQSYDIAQYYNWGNVNTVVNSMTNSNIIAFASEYAKIEANIQTKLADTVKLLNE